MEATITAVTSTDKDVIVKTHQKDFEMFGGHSANICYTQKDWEGILNEPKENTEKRIHANKKNNHHSVFGHPHISVYLVGIPKLLAMILNNEHEYYTSEKSARYTKMNPTERELFLYEKWTNLFEKKIKSMYPNEPYLEKNGHKLAMENARYLISVMTPTKMEYTTSYRQWNYLYQFSQRMLTQNTDNTLINLLKPSLEEFVACLEKLGIITDEIKDYRKRDFTFIVDDNNYPEYFANIYSTNYLATFAQIAQQQRHPSLYYTIMLPKNEMFFTPPIIEEDEKLKKEWLEDIASLSKLMPQGRLVMVNETGTYQNLIKKLQERLCTCAQLETCMQNYQTLLKYTKALRESNDVRLAKILENLEPFEKGARCLSGYVCTDPCGFKEGITLTRKI